MPKKAAKKGTAASARKTLTREARAAYAEVRKNVKHLERSIAEVQRDLSRAERAIEADTRRRISELRKDVRTQLGLLQVRRREAAQTLDRLSKAAGESWLDIKASADTVVSDARSTAATVLERFRKTLGS